jgi:hypothetical protein
VDATPRSDIGLAAENLLDLLETVDEQNVTERISDDVIQRLAGRMIHIYAMKMSSSERRDVEPPVKKNHTTATEAAIFVDRLLQVVDLELFEIQMWRSLGSGY